MSEEVKQIRQKMRIELTEWIEARIPEFMETFDGESPQLPIIEDFRLIVCIADGADPDACDYYPIVDSGTSHHRQVGLIQQAAQYLQGRPADND